MRSMLRMRARMLVAGAGLLLVTSVTGCWNSPQRQAEMRGPNTNIPRTNTSGFPMNPGTGAMPPGGMSQGAMGPGGQPVSRISGAPVGGPGAPGTNPHSLAGAGSPTYFNQTAPGSGPGMGQPIATSANPGTGGVQPVANFTSPSNDPLPPPDKLPIETADASRPRELPSVPPITTQNLDGKNGFRKPSPPPIPIESSAELPLPRDTADLPPLGPPGR